MCVFVDGGKHYLERKKKERKMKVGWLLCFDTLFRLIEAHLIMTQPEFSKVVLKRGWKVGDDRHVLTWNLFSCRAVWSPLKFQDDFILGQSTFSFAYHNFHKIMPPSSMDSMPGSLINVVQSQNPNIILWAFLLMWLYFLSHAYFPEGWCVVYKLVCLVEHFT